MMATLPPEATADTPEPPAWHGKLWPGWARFLLTICAGFHLASAVTLVFAPASQVINAATLPVFALASRYVWAAAFLTVAIGAAFLVHKVAPWRHALLWVGLVPLFLSWWSAFLLAVLAGRGSALSVVIWPALYLPFIAAGFRLALRKR